MGKAVIRNEHLFCEGCRARFQVPYPITITRMVEVIQAFETLHQECPDTSTEPKPDPTWTLAAKISWWLYHGEVGASSKCMAQFFLEHKEIDVSHPYDPDDFSRCHKFFQDIPELRPRVLELGELSRQWTRLAQNWEKLEKMYEQNVREHWQNADAVGMSKFMSDMAFEN